MARDWKEAKAECLEGIQREVLGHHRFHSKEPEEAMVLWGPTEKNVIREPQGRQTRIAGRPERGSVLLCVWGRGGGSTGEQM